MGGEVGDPKATGTDSAPDGCATGAAGADADVVDADGAPPSVSLIVFPY